VRYSGWPIRYADLQPYYARAQAVCDLGRFAYDEEVWTSRDQTPLAFDPEKLRVHFWQISPPTRFGPKYRAELEATGNVRVLLHANATRLAANAAATRVERIEVRSLSGKRATVEAARVVLACGGIENPRLLLASNDVVPHGLGNDHDLVGRFFMDHPEALVGHVLAHDPARVRDTYAMLTRDGLATLPGVCLAEPIQRRSHLLNCSVTIEQEFEDETGTEAARAILRELRRGEMPKHLRARVGRMLADASTSVEEAWRRARGQAPLENDSLVALVARSEQEPDPDSRITLDAERDALGLPRVARAWRLTPQDRRTLLETTRVLAAEFGRLGVGPVEVVPWLADPHADWPHTLAIGLHHMGTTRMAESPALGVVDADCRVHGISNLYVAGSSVFSTSGYANPTLTIVALAIRLADHLKARAPERAAPSA
jgi:choline dehydrogenase-like flavoprotein